MFSWQFLIYSTDLKVVMTCIYTTIFLLGLAFGVNWCLKNLLIVDFKNEVRIKNLKYKKRLHHYNRLLFKKYLSQECNGD